MNHMRAIADGGDWIHEIKFDGYRSQLNRDAGGVRIFTGGLGWTAKIKILRRHSPKVFQPRSIIVLAVAESDMTASNFIALKAALAASGTRPKPAKARSHRLRQTGRTITQSPTDKWLVMISSTGSRFSP